MIINFVLFNIGLFGRFGRQSCFEFFDKSSKKVHVDVFAELKENEPVTNVTFVQDNSNSISGLFVICVPSLG